MYQQQQQPQQETEQVIGTVSHVVVKGGGKWQAVVTPDGSENTRNLWTDEENVASFINSQIGQRLAFACRVSHYSYQGQPTRSLWITAVGAPAMGSPALAGPPQNAWDQAQLAQQQHSVAVPQHVVVQPTVTPMATGQQVVQEAAARVGAQPYDNDPKQGKIHRQTATKVAAILLTNLPAEERTMSSLLALSERLVAYYDNGMPGVQTVEDLMQRALPQSMEGDPGPTDPGYAGDDDIPF